MSTGTDILGRPVDMWTTRGFCAAVNEDGLRCGRAQHEDDEHEWFDPRAAMAELEARRS